MTDPAPPENAPAPGGVIHAFLLDGRGGAAPLTPDEIRQWTPDQGVLWLHLDLHDQQAQSWLQADANLHPLISEALITQETRPRAAAMGSGLLLLLRGVNLNPGAQPDDMVSIRLWLTQERIISTRLRSLLSVDDIVKQFLDGTGPADSASFMVQLADRIVWRMSDTVDDFEDRVADLESRVLESAQYLIRNDLAQLRRQIITLRRYLAPQREAFAKLQVEPVPWLDQANRLRLREVADRLTRHVEDLDAVRERAAVTQEELLSRLSEQVNSRMYMLSLVAAIFLPLGFLTGLFGINVGGIPGAENSWAFPIFIAILILLVACQILIFRWRKWF